MATPLSNLERDFILKAIEDSRRLDGRKPYDYRQLKIEFGVERGCCMVHMGDTRILAQVSSEVVEPKGSRPSEGQLFVNLELSPMASPTFEAGRLSDHGVELNRLLERTIKDSRAVDLESLCIVAGERVWQIRLDVHVLNFDGSILDCASVAAIAALSHFRRPDVTVIGENVTIHSPLDRDPVPLNIHHMPVCVTFAFYHQGTYLLVDPTEKEEAVMEGTVVIGMNVHRELCTMQVTGSMLLLKEQILRCCKIAVVKVSELTDIIKQALENDTRARAEGKKCGFAENHPKNLITAKMIAQQLVDTSGLEEEVNDLMESEEAVDHVVSKPAVKEPGMAQIGEGLTNSWMDADEDEEEEAEEEEEEEENGDKDGEEELEGEAGSEEDDSVPIATATSHRRKEESVSRGSDGESEEEETVTLGGGELEPLPNRNKSTLPSGDLDLTAALKKSKVEKSSAKPSGKMGKKKWKKGRNIKDGT
ncbi:exosome complex component RRP45-like [Diadema setosum]|uniref:exosome complex component RRP45-like n=1 Tax=Diadema setosum TaxID=31175 RepID=UPI003B3AA179